jgi:hypothetical protein
MRETAPGFFHVRDPPPRAALDAQPGENQMTFEKGQSRNPAGWPPGRGRQQAAYLNLTITPSECSHFGHSKVRRSCPGLSGSMRASSIVVPHLLHGGRTIAFDSAVAG